MLLPNKLKQVKLQTWRLCRAQLEEVWGLLGGRFSHTFFTLWSKTLISFSLFLYTLIISFFLILLLKPQKWKKKHNFAQRQNLLILFFVWTKWFDSLKGLFFCRVKKLLAQKCCVCWAWSPAIFVPLLLFKEAATEDYIMYWYEHYVAVQTDLHPQSFYHIAVINFSVDAPMQSGVEHKEKDAEFTNGIHISESETFAVSFWFSTLLNHL